MLELFAKYGVMTIMMFYAAYSFRKSGRFLFLDADNMLKRASVVDNKPKSREEYIRQTSIALGVLGFIFLLIFIASAINLPAS